MKKLVRWMLAPVVTLFEGTWTSGAESCDYLARLKAMPAIDTREERHAA